MDRSIVPIDKLLVNPKNPRFEPVNNQQQAINLMVGKVGKTIFNLAEDIAKHGLNPSKSLMVIENGNYFLPLDGNRRVVAVKLLNDPDKVSDIRYVNLFKELKKEYGTQIPIGIDCTIFPDKESAFRWVNLEHTGKNKGIGTLGWDNEQLNRFIAEYTGNVPAPSIQLFDFANKNGLTHDKVDPTTLERLISTPYVRKIIGIGFPDGILDLEKPENTVINNLQKVFLKMSEVKFKVADVYTVDQRKEWINNLFHPGKKKDTEEKPKKTIIKSKYYSGLINPEEQLPKSLVGTKIDEIFKELQHIEVEKTPHATGALVRILIEVTSKKYLEKNHNFKDDSGNNFRGKDGKKYNELKEKLNFVAQHSPVEMKKLMENLISKGKLTVQLNQVLHNSIFFATASDIKDLWKNLKTVFYFLVEGIK